jgi:ribosomal-protein-alanine N-acetyltransferase
MDKLFSSITCLKGERITLRRLTDPDVNGLRELTESEEVYRYLPTFLYEQKYEDKSYVISHLYDECIQTSLILGVFDGDEFCGLAELYGHNALSFKVSVGYRLLKRCWGKGIATETLGILVNYLFSETEIKIITASTMAENKASANVLKKNGFKHLTYTVFENWGRAKPILTEKWIKTIFHNDFEYQFQK